MINKNTQLYLTCKGNKDEFYTWLSGIEKCIKPVEGLIKQMQIAIMYSVPKTEKGPHTGLSLMYGLFICCYFAIIYRLN